MSTQCGKKKRYDYSKYHKGQERPALGNDWYWLMEQREKIAARKERAGIHS